MLTSCSGGKTDLSLPSQLNCKVSASYLDEDFEGDITSLPSGEFTAVMTAPAGINGLKISINPDGCKVTQNGIELEYPTEKLGNLCPFVRLYDAFNASRHIAPTVSNGENSCVLTYDDGGDKYKFTLDKESGNILKIEVNKIVFEVR